MRKKNVVTYDRLRSLFTYDPDTGVFTNIVDRCTNNNAKAGGEAGTKDKYGYIIISIDDKRYKAHRLVFLYVDGYFPEDGLDVDHINRIPHDNRYSNLRVVSKSCNARNTKLLDSNTSGVKGVVLNRKSNKWTARMRILGKETYLGRFCNFNDAVIVRYGQEMMLGYSDCDRNTSARKYIVDNKIFDNPDNIDQVNAYIKNINKPIRVNSKTGINGVSIQKETGNYVVNICVNRLYHYLGCYKELHVAVMERYKAELKYGYDLTHKDSTAYNYLKDNGYIISEWERS